MEVHAPNPFLITPFCYVEISPLILWNPSLTYLEIPPLCRGANSRPLWSLDGCRLTPPSSLFPFPPPNGSPSQTHALLRRHCDICFTQSDTVLIIDHKTLSD
jgi:hypothetical protein